MTLINIKPQPQKYTINLCLGISTVSTIINAKHQLAV